MASGHTESGKQMNNYELSVIKKEVNLPAYRAFNAILNAADELYEAATSEMDTEDDTFRLNMAVINFEELLEPVVEQEDFYETPHSA